MKCCIRQKLQVETLCFSGAEGQTSVVLPLHIPECLQSLAIPLNPFESHKHNENSKY